MSEILFQCFIPVNRHSSKKNEKEPRYNPRTGKSFIGTSHKAKVAADLMITRLRIHKLKQRIDEPINCDINAKFIFYYPKTVYYTKKGVRSRNIGDLSNIYQLPEDILTKVGIIDDDTLICSHDGSERRPIDGVDYFLEIVLTKK